MHTAESPKANHDRNASALKRFAADERGAATVEYIIIAGMIAIACIIAFRDFGNKVYDKVHTQTTALDQVVDTPR